MHWRGVRVSGGSHTKFPFWAITKCTWFTIMHNSDVQLTFLCGNVVLWAGKPCVWKLETFSMGSGKLVYGQGEACVWLGNPVYGQRHLVYGAGKGARKACVWDVQDGTPCRNAVNISACPFCDYHVQSEYNKIRSKRTECKDSHLHRAFHHADGSRLGQLLSHVHVCARQVLQASPRRIHA